MNYSEPLVNQVTVFCRAVGSGVLLGIIYDAVSAVRMLFGERKSVYVFFDTLYFVIASLVSFFFMVLYNSGQVRMNLMLAELFGAVALHFSFGKYLLGIYGKNLSLIRNFLKFIFRPFFISVRRIQSFLKDKLSAQRNLVSDSKNIVKKSKKFSNISKILLKNKNKSV